MERQMDKDDVAYIYNEILLEHKKEQNWVICSDVDGPRHCQTEWSQKKVLYSSIYMKSRKMVLM